MNVIFCIIFISSAVVISIFNPELFLPALLDGAKGATQTAFTLLAIYVVWMGLSAVAEDAGINRRAARLLQPFCRKFFKTESEEAVKDISMNMTCNLLGIGGAATPFAVSAIGELEKENNTFAQNLLFIINATSIQLIPTTVIALRTAAGSLSPNDIILPSLLATIVSTGVAVSLYFAITKIKGAVIWR